MAGLSDWFRGGCTRVCSFLLGWQEFGKEDRIRLVRMLLTLIHAVSTDEMGRY